VMVNLLEPSLVYSERFFRTAFGILAEISRGTTYDVE